MSLPFRKLAHAVIARTSLKAVERLGLGGPTRADVALAIPGRTFLHRIEQPGAIDGHRDR